MNLSSLGILVLNLLLGLMTILFILRIVLTWYPQIDLNRVPFNLIAWPTEPLLAPMRQFVPTLGGVDITPVIWVGICTLMREILLGQQGLITMALNSYQ
ncbi:YggT family protein [Pleurocapsales cyanobacterium LEGE 06147]|nr:YggT family protein [Pleurocapsales cyanobacterium LEGE 06147]